MENSVVRARRIVRNLGLRCGLLFVFWRLFARWSRRELLTLRPAAVLHELYARPRSSDLDVFGQVFSGDEYACVSRLDGVTFVLDAGANVGYSAAYFLSRYPSATVYSIEPDVDNVRLLVRNLAPYGRRSVVVHAALWPVSADLEVTAGFRDAREWSRQVRPSGGGGGTLQPVRGMTIEEIMSMAGVDRISILKLDIEGAEAALFRDASADWVRDVETFVVELHDDAGFGSASRAFADALSMENLQLSQSGELTIARRDRPNHDRSR